MAREICCNGSDRSDSPDAPNARQPIISPTKPQLLPRSHLSEGNTYLSLTPSDVRELQHNVPTPQKADVSSNKPSTLRSKGSSTSRFFSRIKKHLSRGSGLLRKSPVKATLKLLKLFSHTRADTGPGAAVHDLDLLSDDADPLCGYDADAQPLNVPDLTQAFLHTSPSQPSYSQPSDSCVTSSAEIHRPSESTGHVTDSQTSHSADCQTSDLQDRGTPCRSDVTAWRTSRLGRFPFENSPRSCRARQISQNSDIALAAETLFDTLCSQLSTQHENETCAFTALSNQTGVETQQPQADERFWCFEASPVSFPQIAASNSAHQSIPESMQLNDDKVTNLTVSDKRHPSQHNTVSHKSSIHLYDMRISQHLRSMSNLSNGSSTRGASDDTTNQRPRSTKSIEEDLGNRPNASRKPSSGFSSVAVPSSWGLVVKERTPSEDLALHTSKTRELVYQPKRLPYKPNCDVSFNEGRPILLETSELVITQDPFIDLNTASENSARKPENSKPKNSSQKLILRRGSTAPAHHRSQFSNSYALARMSIIETRLDADKCCEKVSSCSERNERAQGEQESNIYDQLNGKGIHSAIDGPADRLLVPGEPSALPTSPQPESVGGNYEETTVIWERALRAHQEDELHPQRKRGSSFSNVSRKSSRHNRGSSDISDTQKSSLLLEPSPRKSSSHLPTIALKRMNTALSFDLLTIPGRDTVTQPPSPVHAEDRARGSSARLSVDGRIRSISQPPPGRGSIAGRAEMSSPLLVPDVPLHGQRIPDITLTDAQSSNDRSPVVPSRQRKLTGLHAWSRFPSHTRKERNGPAGIADKVLSRDFQADSDSQIDNHIDKDRPAKKLRYAGKSKWRTRAMILSGKFLTDIPTIFKYRTTNEFRRRQHGHRSSISAGGVLEYPELELLPLSEPHVSIPRDDHLPGPMLSKATPSNSSLVGNSSTQRVASQRSTGRLGSSNYGSMPDDSHDSTEVGGGLLTANGWADVYGQYVPHRESQRGSESVSHLDGAYGAFPFSRPASPGSVSLPPMFRKGAFERLESERSRAMSAQGVRRSTQDLCKILEDGEGAELARALKAAEEAFSG